MWLSLVSFPSGELIGKHRKNHSHGYGGEAWVTNSIIAKPICCGSVCVGVMVCSDAWYPECSQRLKRQGAQILLDIAAWPVSKECGDPLPAWQRCSKETGLPMILCNQTGKTPWLDLSKGQSVYIEKGNAELTYNGEEALLLFEWDAATGRAVSERFTVIPFCWTAIMNGKSKESGFYRFLFFSANPLYWQYGGNDI